MSRKSESKGWPAIIVIAVLAAALSVIFSRLISPQVLTYVPWDRLTYYALGGAIVVAICGVGSLLFYRNIHAPQTTVNIGMFIILAASVFGSFGAMRWQQFAQAQARQTMLPVFTEVRTQIDTLDKAYVDQAAGLGVPDLVEWEVLGRGFNPAKARTNLATLRDANKRLHADIEARVADGRKTLMTLKLGSRAKNAQALYHGEFTHKGAGPAQLKYYETYQLDLLDYEVNFLAKNTGRWRVQGDDMALTPDLIGTYEGVVAQRRSNDRYLNRLRGFNTEQVTDKSF